jgi:hypothetical protein
VDQVSELPTQPREFIKKPVLLPELIFAGLICRKAGLLIHAGAAT